MVSKQCEDCGEVFNSAYNLKLHHEYACDGAKETSSSSTDTDSTATSSSKSSKLDEVCSEATGTVVEYNEQKGFGFAVTSDVTQELAGGASMTEYVFIHVKDVPDQTMEEGDRFQFDVIETEKGLRAKAIEEIDQDRSRRRNRRRSPPDPSRLRFGSQKDDTQYGPGKPEPSNQDIEDFQDERKFR